MKVMTDKVEKWDVFELELVSSRDFPKPFEDVELTAWFKIRSTVKKVDGFYDGNCTWRLIFHG